MQSADGQYATDIANAADQYTSNLNSYSGDKTTESMQSFAWPDAPFDNAAVVTTGDPPPAPPTYDGPAFDPSGYGLPAALTAAQDTFNEAETAANEAYSNSNPPGALQIAEAAFSAAKAKAQSDLQATQAAADTAYNNAVSNPPIIPSLGQISDTLLADQNAASAAYVTAQTNIKNKFGLPTQYFAGGSEYQNATTFFTNACQIAGLHYVPATDPEMFRDLSDALARDLKDYTKKIAEIKDEFDKAMADANAQDLAANADAQLKSDQATAVYNQKLADITAKAVQTKAKAYAEAQKICDKAVDAAAEVQAVAIAEAAHDRDVALASAAANLLQAQAAAKQSAISAWSAFSGHTPWSEYQAALAADASSYYAAVRPLIIDHATSLADDAADEAEQLAVDAKIQADATADANCFQSTQSADAVATFALNSDGAAFTRDQALARAAREVNQSWNDQQQTVTKAVADTVQVYTSTAADAAYQDSLANDQAFYLKQVNEMTVDQYNAAQAVNDNQYHNGVIAAAGVQEATENDAEKKSSGLGNDAIASNRAKTASILDTYNEAVAGFAETRDLAVAAEAQTHSNSIATAVSTQTKDDAGAISEFVQDSADDDGTYIVGVAGAAEPWTISDATAQATFQTAVATNYDSLVTQWDTAVGTPWSAYQKALADAQKSYVTRTSAAVTAEVTTIAQQQFQQINQTTTAQENYAAEIAGEQATLSTKVADAVKAQVKDVAQATFDAAKSAAGAAKTQAETKASALASYQNAVAIAHKAEANTMDSDQYQSDLSQTQAMVQGISGQISGSTEATNLKNAAVTAENGDATALHDAVTAIAAAHEAWIDSQCDADTTAAGSLSSAAGTLATKINNATSQAADTKYHAQTNFGSDSAKSVETLSKVMASSQRSYSEEVADAEIDFNSTFDSASSSLREQASEAADNYVVSIYTKHELAMASAATNPALLGDPLIAYQAATASADQTYISYAVGADTQYQQQITVADALQTQKLNDAEKQLAGAEADAAYGEAVQVAAAIRADHRHVGRQCAANLLANRGRRPTNRREYDRPGELSRIASQGGGRLREGGGDRRYPVDR